MQVKSINIFKLIIKIYTFTMDRLENKFNKWSVVLLHSQLDVLVKSDILIEITG